MLEVKNLSAAYGQHPSLNDVSINVGSGEIVVILGANGAGKSTLLRAISGICEGKVSGRVTLSGDSLTGLSSDAIVEKGVALVPEGRGIFGDLTVKENLLLGAYSSRAREAERENLERVLSQFPKLQERQSQIARTMSGGEQQMVAIGRAMMSAPEILMLDEPSLGLSPLLCKELFQNLTHVRDLGIGVLLVEQNAKQSLAISDRGYLLENTRITYENSAAALANDPAVQRAYLGAGSKTSDKPSKRTSAPTEAMKRIRTAVDPTPRRSADQQIGGSIDDLVAIATKTSAEAPRGPSKETAIAAKQLAHSKIDVVLKDIEQAAKNARNRSSSEVQKLRPTPSNVSVEADNALPPVIEVYKRPRVEIYRRRPSGQFERD
ncbi:MAG: ABC transporter ATP-binding protein [Planktotalea sp.]|uniref:ABC transporter ATP-binding protein n=1 Tax=Planktotalea sp. TaxID=2029877 RepID=UPI001D65BAC9|nr:ABC transporter ATP-binding protein [Planktotalea sp.]MBT5822075.1 ABC transporter ATP-binding protein [Paracoccaceae bacterium]MDG1077366.1 ABC transporter ATP-binding protein [Planktotalea sp.]